MKIRELIEKLKTFDQELTVEVWDPYNDESTTDVYAYKYEDKVLVSCNEFSKEEF